MAVYRAQVSTTSGYHEVRVAMKDGAWPDEGAEACRQAAKAAHTEVGDGIIIEGCERDGNALTLVRLFNEAGDHQHEALWIDVPSYEVHTF